MLQIVRNAVLNAISHFNNDFIVSPNEILVERPKDVTLGDVCTNAAMVFAKRVGTTPHDLADTICHELMHNPNVLDTSIAGYGFVNIKVCNQYWRNLINRIILEGDKFSINKNIGNSNKLNVEFVSANPTGPLHTGHARNAVFGSVASNLLEKIGYKVTREFYINDQGNQIKYLAKSVYLRYIELLGTNISEDQFSSDMYCGLYVKDIAQKVLDKYGDVFLNKPESEWLDTLCKFSIDCMLNNIKHDLNDLGVIMDVYTSEAALCKQGLVNEALDILQKHNDIYEGILPKPKGTSKEDWEERPQTLFKSTKYGDDVDRAIKKSDGTWTYFAGDLAYHLDKIRRGFNKMLLVLGADHNGYVKRMKAAVSALSNNEADIEIRLYQLVNFLENGKPVRMSKRKGQFITLKEVVDRVGKDVTRYMMISRHHDVMIDFDFVKAVEFSMDNPLFYIQYAHARICSVFKYYKEIFNVNDISYRELLEVDKSSLLDDNELNLIKQLSFWPEQVKSAAIAIEPHRIPVYLRDIASSFHSLWSKGKAEEQLRFINKNDKEKTLAKLSLLKATQVVLSDGLKILGITPLLEMTKD